VKQYQIQITRRFAALESSELGTNSKITNIRDLYRGINDFKKGYHPKLI